MESFLNLFEAFSHVKMQIHHQKHQVVFSSIHLSLSIPAHSPSLSNSSAIPRKRQGPDFFYITKRGATSMPADQTQAHFVRIATREALSFLHGSWGEVAPFTRWGPLIWMRPPVWSVANSLAQQLWLPPWGWPLWAAADRLRMPQSADNEEGRPNEWQWAQCACLFESNGKAAQVCLVITTVHYDYNWLWLS